MLEGGPNDNNFFNKPKICYNTAVMYDNNGITCSRKQVDVGLKYDSDRGKHAFKGFNKVCNNIDFSNNSNYDSSSCSANNCRALRANMLMKMCICLNIHQLLIMWRVLSILMTLRIVALMTPNFMYPIFGHFVGRLKTVLCTLPIRALYQVGSFMTPGIYICAPFFYVLISRMSPTMNLLIYLSYICS